MLTRFGCMIYSVFLSQNIAVNSLTVQFYFYYQMPFDILNFAVVAQFCQWVEVWSALNSIIRFNKLQQKKQEKQEKLRKQEEDKSPSLLYVAKRMFAPRP